MKNSPRVSVITVFLNSERFVEEAIASVFAQTYDKWELLLVDDGASDGSTAIALQYARQYPDTVRYLEHAGHKNRGISASQNLGMSVAAGEYIAFLDSDDVWLPEKLDHQVSILDSQPEAIMVYGQTQYWYSWDPEGDRCDLTIDPGVGPDCLIRPPLLFVRFVREEIPIPCPSDVMVRRKAALEAGGFEDSFRRIFTDQVLYAKLSLKWPIFVSGQNWIKYRKHSDSAVAVVKKNGQLRAARFEYLKWLGSYVSDHAITDARVRGAITSAIWKCRFPGLVRLRSHSRYRALILREHLGSLARRTLPGILYRLLRTQRDVEATDRID